MMRLFEWMEFFFYLLFFFLPIFDRDIVETWELRENDNAKLAKKKNFKISLLVTEKRHRTEKGLVDEDCVEFSMFSFFFLSLFKRWLSSCRRNLSPIDRDKWGTASKKIDR